MPEIKAAEQRLEKEKAAFEKEKAEAIKELTDKQTELLEWKKEQEILSKDKNSKTTGISLGLVHTEQLRKELDRRTRLIREEADNSKDVEYPAGIYICRAGSGFWNGSRIYKFNDKLTLTQPTSLRKDPFLKHFIPINKWQEQKSKDGRKSSFDAKFNKQIPGTSASKSKYAGNQDVFSKTSDMPRGNPTA